MPPKKKRKVGGEEDLAPILPNGTNFTNSIIRDVLTITKYIGNGGFGRIYEGKLINKGTKICIKMEKKDSSGLFVEKGHFERFLKKDLLENFFKKEFISLPYLVCFGIYTINLEDKLRYLAMPLYEEGLNDFIKDKVDSKLSQEEAKKVSICALKALEYLHNAKISHRDIKKDNLMLLKKGNLDKVVLIDLGISQWHTRFNETINPNAKHSGTLLYTSTDAHLGREGVFRSDLEIFGYNLIEWLNGSLPWKGLESKPEEIYQMKKKIVNDPKTEIKSLLPSIDTSFIQELFLISSSLKYSEVPPYDTLKNFLKGWVTTKNNHIKTVPSKKKSVKPSSLCKNIRRSVRNCGKNINYVE
ncbi:Nucleosomal histone kinase 1 [Strongyloides ratti]|uniref:non-specific serine/threonine protein kinase n=1 Tax=Strongyloides ratti TaxID=34506 RepID=A0A090LHX5_STRRB|nr:Nucleosomal histone kinase 1 [Strongyloides ratti]CEF67723.1 Nucleosomal histone kinase 1 [Strongyloides ratti]